MSLITNLIAILIIILGFLSPYYKDIIVLVGFFSLSGALTSWLAIYMLFEKVPFLVGSGVIPNRFEEFKQGIQDLIMNQFFTKKRLDTTVNDLFDMPSISSESIVNSIDHNRIFKGLTEAILESQFGGMLAMVGGAQALEPLKDPIKDKLNTIISDMLAEDSLTQSSLDITAIREKIKKIVDDRLDELSPEMVKDIVQAMIKQHLGWLVVWGGFFGGLIGFVMAILL